jgi:5-methyltetrahydrofolate--homocysteine methyltransferase
LGVNTTCGASNISFGLPNRHGINAAFLPMAIGAGMTSRDHEPGAHGRDGGDPRRQLPDEPRPNGGEWIRPFAAAC